jgi:CheY-like chemotaxis protein
VQQAERAILVIEDDPDIRETYRDVLESEGYPVYTAHDGGEGLRVLEHLGHRACLVLLDLMMPVMNGWQFLQELHRRRELEETPVVVVTAVDADPGGAVRVMRKPVDVDELLETVRRYC